MTVADLVLPAGTLIFTSSTDVGLSHDADRLRRLTEDLAFDFSAPAIALAPPETRLALEEVYREASVDNWDGYGAKAVAPETYERARLFLNLIPTTAPPAEVSAEPDGEISFEWRRGPWRLFSVSVGPTSRLTYAGLFGRRRAHGTEFFVNELPEVITRNLRRLLGETSG